MGRRPSERSARFDTLREQCTSAAKAAAATTTGRDGRTCRAWDCWCASRISWMITFSAATATTARRGAKRNVGDRSRRRRPVAPLIVDERGAPTPVPALRRCSSRALLLRRPRSSLVPPSVQKRCDSGHPSWGCFSFAATADGYSCCWQAARSLLARAVGGWGGVTWGAGSL